MAMPSGVDSWAVVAFAALRLTAGLRPCVESISHHHLKKTTHLVRGAFFILRCGGDHGFSRERCETSWSRNIWFDIACDVREDFAQAKPQGNPSPSPCTYSTVCKDGFLCSNYLFYNNFSTLQKNGGRIGFAPQISHTVETSFATTSPEYCLGMMQ